MAKAIFYIDGASRGNPGPSGYGVCLLNGKDRIVKEFFEYIGIATNSVAEYRALLRALQEAIKTGVEEVVAYTDSQLVARQFEGSYRVKDANLKTLMTKIRELEKNFKKVTVLHIPRSSHPANKRADQLANIAINRYGPTGKSLMDERDLSFSS